MRKIQFGVLVATFILAVGARAQQMLPQDADKQTWSGTLSAVDLRNHTLIARDWLFPKTFVLGQNSIITIIGEKQAKASDLRPGEMAKIDFQDVHGVLVADRVTDESLRYQGTVQTVNEKSRVVTFEHALSPKTFKLADDCEVVQSDGMEASIYDLNPGDKATVTYELSGNSPVAYRIKMTTSSYEGKLEALDLPERILKASDLLGEKQFSVADQCRILLGGSKTGRLTDLRLDKEYTFTYEQVNGVNIIDQIAPATQS